MGDAGIGDPELRRVLHECFAWGTMTTMSADPDDAGQVPIDLPLPGWSWDGLQP